MADSTQPKKETGRISVPPLIDQVPMPLCWGLVAISATVLILQIWNYLS